VPKDAHHIPERTAVRHGSEPGQLTLDSPGAGAPAPGPGPDRRHPRAARADLVGGLPPVRGPSRARRAQAARPDLTALDLAALLVEGSGW
jgi:hypothetical protein